MPSPSQKGLVFTGARARLSIDGQVVGYATGCSGSEEVQYEPVRTLDNIRTVEFVPIGYDVSFNASRVRLIPGSLRGPELDVFPKLGVDSQDQLRNILDKADMSVQIDDTVSDTPFMIMEQCKITRHSWTISARGVVGEDIDFVGTHMRDESEA